MNNQLDTLLESFGACAEAREWVHTEGHTTLAAAWNVCPRGDWMLWLAGKMSGAPEGEGRKRLVLAACECARLALPHAEGPEPLACIETAEQWARGNATIQTLIDARRKAVAAYAAAYYSAYSAVAAATAAITPVAPAPAAAAAAYAAAAYAAAKKQTLARCADAVRKQYSEPPTNTELQ